jgi:hypothetical protein
MSTIITVPFTYYRFNLDKPEEAEAYKNLSFPKCKVWTMYYYSPSTKKQRDFGASLKKLGERKTIDLETKHLFSNQWNTTEEYENLRIHRWAEWDYPNRDIKEGYFIEITEELQHLLDNTLACEYCSHQEPKTVSNPTYCPSCVGSEYLSEDLLPLTKLQPVSSKKKRDSFDKDLYLKEHGDKLTKVLTDRKAKKRDDLIEKYESKAALNKFQFETQLLLLDNEVIDLNNVIYYDHRKMWTFGWYTKLTDEEKVTLAQKLSSINFPHQYEIVNPR